MVPMGGQAIEPQLLIQAQLHDDRAPFQGPYRNSQLVLQ